MSFGKSADKKFINQRMKHQMKEIENKRLSLSIQVCESAEDLRGFLHLPEKHKDKLRMGVNKQLRDNISQMLVENQQKEFIKNRNSLYVPRRNSNFECYLESMI